jgi:hypothetical protein
MTPEAHFRATAPAYMRKLVADFPTLDLQDAAAIFGNLGHESLGFTKLQEINPTVKGSKGGYGWAQWTGPRRRAFEAWCKKHGKNPAADATNYAYLYLELKGLEGTESGAIGKVSAAVGLDAKVIAFERAYLRAGVKHDDSRLAWARIAADAVRATEAAPTPVQPRPRPIPAEPAIPGSQPRTSKGWGCLGWSIVGLVVLAGLAVAAFTIPLPF